MLKKIYVRSYSWESCIYLKDVVYGNKFEKSQKLKIFCTNFVVYTKELSWNIQISGNIGLSYLKSCSIYSYKRKPTCRELFF